MPETASSTMRNMALSSSVLEPRVRAHRLEAHGHARATSPLRGRAPQGWDEAEIVEDHRPDVEDECLCRLERALDHGHELAQLPFRLRWVARDQPLTTCAWSAMLAMLCAGPSCISRAISRRISSWAAITSRDEVVAPRPVDSCRASSADTRRAADPGHDLAQPLVVTMQRALLALEHLQLALHHRLAARLREQLGARLAEHGRISVRAPGRGRSSAPLPGLGAASWRSASEVAWRMSSSISASSRSRVVRSCSSSVASSLSWVTCYS